MIKRRNPVNFFTGLILLPFPSSRSTYIRKHKDKYARRICFGADNDASSLNLPIPHRNLGAVSNSHLRQPLNNNLKLINHDIAKVALGHEIAIALAVIFHITVVHSDNFNTLVILTERNNEVRGKTVLFYI